MAPALPTPNHDQQLRLGQTLPTRPPAQRLHPREHREHLALWSSSGTLDGQLHFTDAEGRGWPLYPIACPRDQRKFALAIYDLLVASRQTLTSRELCRALDHAGVRARDLDPSKRDGVIADPALRAGLAELTHRMLIPIVYSGKAGGFRLACDRAEVELYANSLSGRLGAIRSAEKGIRSGLGWYSETADQRLARLERLPDHQRKLASRMLWHLADAGYRGSTRTNAQLVALLEADGLTTSDWHPAGKGGQLSDSLIRAIIHTMRETCGLPVTGQATGYQLAPSAGHAVVAANALCERADAIAFRALRLRVAGACWYPESGDLRDADIRHRHAFQMCGIKPSPTRARECERQLAAKARARANRR